jgi:peroxiredoxin
MKLLFLPFVFMLGIGYIHAQSHNGKHYLIESAKFSPPIKDMVASFEGKKAPAFLADDIHKVAQSLSQYQGHQIVLLFWSTKNPDPIVSYLPDFSKQLLQKGGKLITFAEEDRATVERYASTHALDFTIIPNGSFLGEMIYGKELGLPRFFLVDRTGIVRKVIPAEGIQDVPSVIAHILEGITNDWSQ